MPRNDKDDAVAVLERPAETVRASVTNQPKLVVPVGRGRTGKTVFACWAAERALNAGRTLILADADRTNQTLAGRFPGMVVNPPGSHDYSMRAFLDGLIERQIEDRSTVLLDLGGGDQMLKRTAEEIPLVAFLEGHGIWPVAVHMIGPDLDDLAYLQDVELTIDEKTGETAEGYFAPERTVLVLNEGAVPGDAPPKEAFADVQRHEIIRAAVRRGAKVVVMPALPCMRLIANRQQAFVAAWSGEADRKDGAVLGPMNRQRVKTWWERMEEAFAPVAEWLP